MRKSYKGKVVNHRIWYEYDGNTKKEFETVTMSPTQVGMYFFQVQREKAPTYIERFASYHCSFDEVVIEGNQLSFYSSTQESYERVMKGFEWKPFLVITLEEGEVERLLQEDHWFKSQHWFRVTQKHL